MAVLGLATGLLCWLWYRAHMSRRSAALLALAVVASPWFFDYAHRALSEVPFAGATVLFFWLASRPAPEGRGARWGLLAAVWLAGTLLVLLRGNGLLLVPALVLAALTARRNPLAGCAARLRPAGVVLFGAALLIVPVALMVRNAYVDYPGVNGSAYLEEVLAKEPADVWARDSRQDSAPIARAGLGDFKQRVYQNVLWGQGLNYPRLICYPIGLLLDRLNQRTLLEWAVVLPVWLVLLVGAPRMHARAPAAFWFLVLNAAVLVVWPWPWGAMVRFLLPFLPLLMLLFYLGLERLLPERAAQLVLAALVLAGIGFCIRDGWQQARTPYASEELNHMVTLVHAAEQHARPGEDLVLEDGIQPLAHVLTGRRALLLRHAVARLHARAADSALVLVSVERPGFNDDLKKHRITEGDEFTIEVLQSEGGSALWRVRRAGGS
jgi:4-amino-4-deoxy-L-arabinose transferase-like glycosyltransferase